MLRISSLECSPCKTERAPARASASKVVPRKLLRAQWEPLFDVVAGRFSRCVPYLTHFPLAHITNCSDAFTLGISCLVAPHVGASLTTLSASLRHEVQTEGNIRQTSSFHSWSWHNFTSISKVGCVPREAFRAVKAIRPKNCRQT